MKKRLFILVPAVLLSIVWGAHSGLADTIYLKDGKVYEGKELDRTDPTAAFEQPARATAASRLTATNARTKKRVFFLGILLLVRL